jgi:hypothetical protein
MEGLGKLKKVNDIFYMSSILIPNYIQIVYVSQIYNNKRSNTAHDLTCKNSIIERNTVSKIMQVK